MPQATIDINNNYGHSHSNICEEFGNLTLIHNGQETYDAASTNLSHGTVDYQDRNGCYIDHIQIDGIRQNGASLDSNVTNGKLYTSGYSDENYGVLPIDDSSDNCFIAETDETIYYPDEQQLDKDGSDSMIKLLQRTGYTMIQENGQRKYGGPPPNWQGDPPSRGCEIFVGKIPRDLYEDKLVPLFETVGPLYELRLMMDFSGTNRGYAFVMYTNKDDARQAIKCFNNYEIRKGKTLGVCPSVDNCRLFIGGLPRDKTEYDIKENVSQLTEGVINVILYPSAEEKTKNRGYAFIEYDCHKSAAMARRKLVPGKIQLWGKPIIVDWAEPEVDVDEEILENVKILYVRNLMLNTTEEVIKEHFQKACNGSEGSIDRVKKIKDYAFVHFLRREDALCALEAMNGQHIEGSLIEVSLAKPIDQSYYNQYSPKPRIILNSSLERRTCPKMNNGIEYNNGILDSDNPKMANIRAMRGAGGLRGNPLRLRGYRPQREKKLYEAREKTNMVFGFSKQGDFIYEKNFQILEEFCNNLGWKLPEYRIDIIKKSDSCNKEIRLFVGKVRINELSQNYFQATQMGLTGQEAKLYAADYMLNFLRANFNPQNIPLDSKNYEGDPLVKMNEKFSRNKVGSPNDLSKFPMNDQYFTPMISPMIPHLSHQIYNSHPNNNTYQISLPQFVNGSNNNEMSGEQINSVIQSGYKHPYLFNNHWISTMDQEFINSGTMNYAQLN